jgi:hypothetical protein
MRDNAIETIERTELIQKLISWGYGDLIKTLIDNEGDVYTKKGRLNKSGACRALGWKNKQLEDALAACRQILHEEED